MKSLPLSLSLILLGSISFLGNAEAGLIFNSPEGKAPAKERSSEIKEPPTERTEPPRATVQAKTPPAPEIEPVSESSISDSIEVREGQPEPEPVRRNPPAARRIILDEPVRAARKPARRRDYVYRPKPLRNYVYSSQSAPKRTAPAASPVPAARLVSPAPPAKPTPVPSSSDIPEEIVTPQGLPTGKKPVESSATEPAEDEAPRGDEVNAAFPYTHSLPSPANLPGGTWVIGTSVAYGITDFLQVSTDVVRDVNRYWNVSAKVPLIEYPTFIASAFVNWDTFNFVNFDKSNPDLRVTSWQPGLVTGYEVGDDMAMFIGGNFHITSTKVPDVRTSGYSRGARVQTEWSYLYNARGSRLQDNAISVGAAYDVTYKLWSIGATHHWPTFLLGIDYTINADNDRILPKVAFSTGFSF